MRFCPKDLSNPLVHPRVETLTVKTFLPLTAGQQPAPHIQQRTYNYKTVQQFLNQH